MPWGLTVSLVFVLALGLGWAGGSGTAVYAGLTLPLWAVLSSFLWQWLCFAIAYRRQTETWFDLMGSLNYIALVFLLLVLGPLASERTLLLGCCIVIWAARLGSFLFLRIREAGGDSRFEKIRTRFGAFLITWSLQAFWVVATSGCALAAMAASDSPALTPLDLFALALWVLGLVVEITADEQKHRFRRQPGNAGRFIRSGLWSVCQHPNYLGEILLWCGVALLALPALAGAQYLTLLSPLFVAVLLLKISGIPLLQKAARQRWGEDPAWREYVQATPVLVPWLGRGLKLEQEQAEQERSQQ